MILIMPRRAVYPSQPLTINISMSANKCSRLASYNKVVYKKVQTIDLPILSIYLSYLFMYQSVYLKAFNSISTIKQLSINRKGV